MNILALLMITASIISTNPHNPNTTQPIGSPQIAIEIDDFYYPNGGFVTGIAGDIEQQQIYELSYDYPSGQKESLQYYLTERTARILTPHNPLKANYPYSLVAPDFGFRFLFTTTGQYKLNNEMAFNVSPAKIYPKTKTASCKYFYIVAWQDLNGLFMSRMGWDNEPMLWEDGTYVKQIGSSYYYSETQSLDIAMNDNCYGIYAYEVDAYARNTSYHERVVRTFNPAGETIAEISLDNSLDPQIIAHKDSYKSAYDTQGLSVGITNSNKICIAYQMPKEYRKDDRWVVNNYIKVVLSNNINLSGYYYVGEDWGNDQWQPNAGKIVNIPPLFNQPNYGPMGLSVGTFNGGSAHDGAYHPTITCNDDSCIVAFVELDGNVFNGTPNCDPYEPEYLNCGGDNMVARAFDWSGNMLTLEKPLHANPTVMFDRWLPACQMGDIHNFCTYIDDTAPYPQMADIKIVFVDDYLNFITNPMVVNSYDYNDQIAPSAQWIDPYRARVTWTSNNAHGGGYGKYYRDIDYGGTFHTQDNRVNDFTNVCSDLEEWQYRHSSNAIWSQPSGSSSYKNNTAFGYVMPSDTEGYAGCSRWKSNEVRYNSLVSDECTDVGQIIMPYWTATLWDAYNYTDDGGHIALSGGSHWIYAHANKDISIQVSKNCQDQTVTLNGTISNGTVTIL